MNDAKSITIPPDVSPLKTEQVLVRYHFSILTPDRLSPCSIYIYFKGKYLEIIKRDAIVPIQVLAKMINDQNFFFYISEKEQYLFDFYLKNRHSFKTIKQFDLDENTKIKDHRISQYLKLSSSHIVFKEDNVTTRMLSNDSLARIRETSQCPSLEWFFEEEFSKEVLTHTSSVVYLTNLFLECNKNLYQEINFNVLNYAIIIHHLTESPKNKSDNYSKSVLSFLREKNIPLIEPIVQMISYQDEFYDGSGKLGIKGEDLPIASQVFSIFDQFEHQQLNAVNLTKSKAFQGSIDQLKNNPQKFKPKVLKEALSFFELIKSA